MTTAYAAEITIRSVDDDIDSTLYVATEEYITRASDTPSGTPFAGTLDRLPRFDRSIVGGEGFGGLTVAWGDIGLINTGEYDLYLRGHAVDGRRVVFRSFDPTLAYASSTIVADKIARNLIVNDQTAVISLRDKGFKLEVPTQPAIYAGTGETEGGVELTGKRRNMALGTVLNITPVLLIAGELVSEVNGGRAVQAISAVYDKGYPLNGPQADYATLAGLRAADVTDGWYSTCLAVGALRTGASYQQLTCDVQGDNVGGFVSTTGTIIRRIIAITGCLSDPTEIDTTSFNDFETASGQPATIGYYLDENSTETVSDTIDKLSKGVRGFCGFTRLGLLQIGIFKVPSGSPVSTFTETSPGILEIDADQLPSGMDPPPNRQRVSFERNWTVINDSYAGVLVSFPARAAWLATPYKVVSTSNAQSTAILADHPMSQDPTVREAYFALEVDAQADAEESLTLANSGYALYRFLLKMTPFTFDIDQTIHVTHSRLGLSGGRLLRLASISDIPENDTVEVRAFG